MRQIRARIREKRGADYTEAELEKLASVKLEKFLDPRGLRSDLVQQFRARLANEQTQDEVTEAMLYETHRPMLRKIRQWLNPVLKLFINPAAVSGAIQAQAKRQSDVLFYEVVHNLVVEITRLGIEVHNMKMRVESMSSRLDFDERRSRSLEGSVQYRPQRRQEGPRSPASPESPRSPGSPGSQPSYGMPIEPAPRAEPPINVTSAPPVFGAREQNGGQAQGQQSQNQSQNQGQSQVQSQGQGQGQGQGRPDGQNGGNRPDGSRRRRRRRRRRPGQNMADQTGSQGSMGSAGSMGGPGGASQNPQAGAGGFDGADDGPDDGPDDDGAGNS